MSKHRPNKLFSWSTIGGVGLVAAAIIIGALMIHPPATLAPATPRDKSAITITTADGVKLAATYKAPAGQILSPVVILLHEYGQDRHQWDPYRPSFLAAGIAVLSYDMRGFGESRLAVIPPDQATHLNSLPLDLPAVLNYLKAQPHLDQSKISLVGASIGADVAFVASGSQLDVHRAVLLSPVVSGPALDGHTVPGFAPAGVFGLSSTQTEGDLNVFMAKVKDPQQIKVISGGGPGLELLATAGVLDSVIQWIKQ